VKSRQKPGFTISDPATGEFDIGPGSELLKKYGWYAENRPIIHVKRSEVPENLRNLIPYVERWAIACDITRHDYFEKQPKRGVREFSKTVGRREAEINAWLDEIDGEWPEAAYQFMYLLEAWSET
jgi:hypothetical protein